MPYFSAFSVVLHFDICSWGKVRVKENRQEDPLKRCGLYLKREKSPQEQRGMREGFVSVGIRVYCRHAICPSHRAEGEEWRRMWTSFPLGPGFTFARRDEEW